MRDQYDGRIFLSTQLLVVSVFLVACSQRQAASNNKPQLGSQPRNSNAQSQTIFPGGSGNDKLTTDSCGQEGGSCAPIALSVNFAGTYAESSGVKFWFGTKGSPVNWQVRISDVPDRPVVASLKLSGARFEQSGSSEGMTTYKIRYTPQSTVSADQAEVLIRDVKSCLTITQNTNLCNSASGSPDNRFDTKAIIAFRVESSAQGQGPNTGLQIFSCVAKTIGVLAGGKAGEVTGAINQGLGEQGCK